MWRIPIPRPAASSSYVEHIEDYMAEDPSNPGGNYWVVLRGSELLDNYIHPGFHSSYTAVFTDDDVEISGTFNYLTGVAYFASAPTAPKISAYRPRFLTGSIVETTHLLEDHQQITATGEQVTTLCSGASTTLHDHPHDHLEKGTVGYFTAWVTSENQTVTLGSISAYSMVLRVQVYVQTAFNSDGSDNLVVGHVDDNDAYATTVDVSTTGRKSVSEGVSARVVEMEPRTIKAYYTNGGSEPTTGKAHVLVEYIVTTED